MLTYGRGNIRKREAELIVCGHIRQRAADGESEARAILLRHLSAENVADRIERWGIDPLNIDALGEISIS